MTDPTPISTPAGYVPAYAVGFSDSNANYVTVSSNQPLPVALVEGDASPTVLTGTTSENILAGPFDAVPGKVVTVALDGDWSGNVKLLRSADGGTTKQELRIAGAPWAQYSKPGFEQAWLETQTDASFYLEIALNDGTVAYRVSQ